MASSSLRGCPFPTYVAFAQSSDLLLHRFRLPQEAFLDGQLLQPALAGPHIVDLGVAERASPFQQVLRVVPDVAALYLD